MSCQHSPFTCGACEPQDDDLGLEYVTRETIPQSTAATASVLLEAVTAAKDETRLIAERLALKERECEGLRIQLVELKKKLKAKAKTRRKK